MPASTCTCNADKPLSYYHRRMHREMVELARASRHDGAAHARIMDLARASRVYFEHFRSLGN